jgi:prevent-host-death family protein
MDMVTKNTRKQVLPATEVKNRFGQVLGEIARTGGPIIVERGGKAVAVILGIEAYRRLRPAGRAADRRALALEGFGMWAGRADIDDDWLTQGRARWHSEWVNA